MTYRIAGLQRQQFETYFAMDDATLASVRAKRVVAGADRGFPCRVSLDDAADGETLILLNYVSQPAETPYHTAYAIYVRENAAEAAYVDQTPPVFAGRDLSLRGFRADGMVVAARLVPAGTADTAIRDLFGDPDVAYIHAHNAAYGCFAARIDRDGETSL
jgi:hypothetical protein